MRTNRGHTRTGLLRAVVVLLALAAGSGALPAVEPGVDLAVPRMSIITVDGATFAFHPNVVRVEQSDYVRWNWTGGAHTTNSGAACTSNGLWASNLSSITTSFTRQFADVPAAYPFFCSPHCATFGMTGQITVTTDIQVGVTDAGGGAVQLDWTGGAAPFRIFRSDNPAFTGANTIVLTAGTAGPSFLDANAGTPPLDKAFFYLVMEQ